ncbi:hypothetical protein RB12997 [Rhodopirellula baltica SH 1]|uniref:Uncharacterized protein n=1 Tax=Rhodopirellula baltica (strain DSM 10527 / NCIMB 13988 / SH1) TaxID=243090 RepID=Q7UHT5_RHOBA|nr:hypothetical protein RB12997 [Rhodopirellula baltica SH 1]
MDSSVIMSRSIAIAVAQSQDTTHRRQVSRHSRAPDRGVAIASHIHAENRFGVDAFVLSRKTYAVFDAGDPVDGERAASFAEHPVRPASEWSSATTSPKSNSKAIWHGFWEWPRSRPKPRCHKPRTRSSPVFESDVGVACRTDRFLRRIFHATSRPVRNAATKQRKRSVCWRGPNHRRT